VGRGVAGKSAQRHSCSPLLGIDHASPGADDLSSMQKLTVKDLAEHVNQLKTASVDELDELLTDLLVQVYPTKSTQDS
jgi:hypothetical protein